MTDERDSKECLRTTVLEFKRKSSMVGVLDSFMSTWCKLESSERRDLQFRKFLQVVGMSYHFLPLIPDLIEFLAKPLLMMNYYLKHLATETLFFPLSCFWSWFFIMAIVALRKQQERHKSSHLLGGRERKRHREKHMLVIGSPHRTEPNGSKQQMFPR